MWRPGGSEVKFSAEILHSRSLTDCWSRAQITPSPWRRHSPMTPQGNVGKRSYWGHLSWARAVCRHPPLPWHFCREESLKGDLSSLKPSYFVRVTMPTEVMNLFMLHPWFDLLIVNSLCSIWDGRMGGWGSIQTSASTSSSVMTNAKSKNRIKKKLK